MKNQWIGEGHSWTNDTSLEGQKATLLEVTGHISKQGEGRREIQSIQAWSAVSWKRDRRNGQPGTTSHHGPESLSSGPHFAGAVRERELILHSYWPVQKSGDHWAAAWKAVNKHGWGKFDWQVSSQEKEKHVWQKTRCFILLSLCGLSAQITRRKFSLVHWSILHSENSIAFRALSKFSRQIKGKVLIL